jgi:hypothetical protein
MKGGQAERDVWLVGNCEAVLELLRPFSRCIVAQGHLHENEHLAVEGIHFVSVGAIAGAWWSGRGFADCIDGSPRGYLIADIEGPDVQLHYQAAGCAPDYRACVFLHQGRHYVNVFFGDAAEPVEAYTGGEWVRLGHAPELVMRDRWVSSHVWALPAGMSPEGIALRTRLRGREVRIGRAPLVEQYMNEVEDRRF